ncbi:MAG: hypothetical protein HY611_08225 [Elusimicrobia bacterium]|nr:hypothetical protein [Elusimicrobiota bacterium]
MKIFSIRIGWMAALTAAAGLSLAGCKKPPQVSPEPRFSAEQRESRFYYDLGAVEIDVGAYPKKRQDGYAVFARTCSQCHTLARPINAPFAERKDWERYIQRMRIRTKSRSGTGISKAEAAVVLDFLVYDSKIRKLDKKSEFAAKSEELRRLFEEVQKERERLRLAESEGKTQPPPPYTGDKPRP